MALLEHRANYDVLGHAARFPFRDSVDDDGRGLYEDSPSAALDAVNASGVAVHILSGWYDMWVRDATLWFANLIVPRKLTIGPGAHTGRAEIDLHTEHLRWFDHWLKGVDNGVMAEPPVRYRTINGSWRTADEWPPEGVRVRSWFLASGPSGTVGSVNDGRLRESISDGPGLDEYRVDYSTSSGRTSRWANGYGGEFGYEPMNANDRRALTWTTTPLVADLDVTGHPVARLWIGSTYPDGDFFVYLEDVDRDGTSRYVTEGLLRASRRALAQAPYDNLGLPYHACTTGAVEALGPVPVELVIDLHPVSYLFPVGHRIRVALTCRDRDNADTPTHEPPPVVTLHRGPHTRSRIDLPVMPRDSGGTPCP
jgi:putative CocE/NonD family hydrolase